MGKSLLNTHFAVGGTVVINNKFAFPASVVKQMVEEHITGFSGVPSTYAYLLHRSPLTAYRDRLSSLRYCSQAGGHMSKAIKEGLRKALPEHTQIFIMYGATEVAARLSYLEPERFEDKMDSIGKAIPGVTFRLLDEKGKEVRKGQVGELVASGDNIMQGYWKDPEMTAKALDRSGYHTGDLCYQDEEGFFFLVGRKDNLVKVGGHRINPLEIEDVLMGTGFLMEATVLGLPDELLGQRLVALVAPKNEDCDSRVILSLCASKLPRHKVPSEVKFTRSLPKNASGKIDSVKCLESFTGKSAGCPAFLLQGRGEKPTL
jgi:acyl-CoA synthetase (AMP-forming)/AMP-acid ligase II